MLVLITYNINMIFLAGRLGRVYGLKRLHYISSLSYFIYSYFISVSLNHPVEISYPTTNKWRRGQEVTEIYKMNFVSYAVLSSFNFS